MKIIVIGAVAAGTSAAAKASRNDKNAQIVVYDKDSFISYSGCGMPYFMGKDFSEEEKLYPRNPQYFLEKYGVTVLIRHEVYEINTKEKFVKVRNLNTGEDFIDSYDKLILATGAIPIIPKIEGINNKNVFTLRNINDMKNIVEFINTNKPEKASIIGSGFIGLELCESLKKNGINVVLIEKMNLVAPGFDENISNIIKKTLEDNGVSVLTASEVTRIDKKSITLKIGTLEDTDMVILAIGVNPNTDLAQKSGIGLGPNNAILVDENMQTNIKDIYACGDCIENKNYITGKHIFRPLGSTANKTGRIAGENATGGNMKFKGIVGTGIFKLFDLTVGRTGLSSAEAEKEGYNVISSSDHKLNKVDYMGGQKIYINAVADTETGKFLGAQVAGYEGVDKRLDVFATALMLNATVEDLCSLDLGYAPPYATAKDAVIYTGMILDNEIKKNKNAF